MSFAGIVVSAAQLGLLRYATFRPLRKLGEFTADVVVRESHKDDLEITSHPVEQGAQITDHAFLQPAEVTLEMAWSASPVNRGALGGVTGLLKTATSVAQDLNDVYLRLLQLQSRRELFDVYTGRRRYQNMLLRSLSVTTERETENVLQVTAVCRQIIIVQTKTTPIAAAPAEDQRFPATTFPVSPGGVKSLVPAGGYAPLTGP